MTVHIVEIPPMRVLSMRVLGDYSQMPETWGRMMEFVERHGLKWPGMQGLSAFHDHSSDIAMAQRRTDVCVTIPEDVDAPTEEAFVQTLPGGLSPYTPFEATPKESGPCGIDSGGNGSPTPGGKSVRKFLLSSGIEPVSAFRSNTISPTCAILYNWPSAARRSRRPNAAPAESLTL